MARKLAFPFLAIVMLLGSFIGMVPTTQAAERIASGPGNTISFPAGSEIIAGYIELDSGEQYENCYYNRTPTGGTLKDGVINPFPQERANAQYNCTYDRQINKPVASAAAAPVVNSVNVAPSVSKFIHRSSDPNDAGVWVIKITYTDGTEEYKEDGAAQRRTTGQNNVLRFVSGERVWGNEIVLDSGQTFTNCMIDVWADGSVKTGVINPWNGEAASAPVCGAPAPAPALQPVVVPAPQPASSTNGIPDRTWRISGEGRSITFEAGETVQGVRITLQDGRYFDMCRIENSPMRGSVYTGVVNPTQAEINRDRLPLCFSR